MNFSKRTSRVRHRLPQLSPTAFPVCHGFVRSATISQDSGPDPSLRPAELHLRVLIVDDHEAVRVGVRAILSIRPDVEVCGEAANGQEALDKAQELSPDVIIMDITMPVVDGFTAAREISKVVPHVAVLLLSMHESPNLLNVAKSSGASGYVAKSEGSAALLRAIDALAQHRTFFPDPQQPATAH